jgi:hypothetical protein
MSSARIYGLHYGMRPAAEPFGSGPSVELWLRPVLMQPGSVIICKILVDRCQCGPNRQLGVDGTSVAGLCLTGLRRGLTV